MNLYSISLLFLQNSLAREQYPWNGSYDIDEDVELLLKQGIKLGFLPKTPQNGKINSSKLNI